MKFLVAYKGNWPIKFVKQVPNFFNLVTSWSKTFLSFDFSNSRLVGNALKRPISWFKAEMPLKKFNFKFKSGLSHLYLASTMPLVSELNDCGWHYISQYFWRLIWHGGMVAWWHSCRFVKSCNEAYLTGWWKIAAHSFDLKLSSAAFVLRSSDCCEFL